MSEEILQHEKQLSIRERVAIQLILMILKIVKPTSSTYDFDKEITKINEELKQPKE